MCLYPQISSLVAFNRLAGIAQIMEQVGDVFQKKQGEEWGVWGEWGVFGKLLFINLFFLIY